MSYSCVVLLVYGLSCLRSQCCHDTAALKFLTAFFWYDELPIELPSFYFLKFVNLFVVFQKVHFSINTGAVVWLTWIIFNSSTEGGTQRYNGKMAVFHVSEPHWWVVTAFISFDLHIMYFKVCFTTTVAESGKSSFQDIGILFTVFR